MKPILSNADSGVCEPTDPLPMPLKILMMAANYWMSLYTSSEHRVAN